MGRFAYKIKGKINVKGSGRGRPLYTGYFLPLRSFSLLCLGRSRGQASR